MRESGRDRERERYLMDTDGSGARAREGDGKVFCKSVERVAKRNRDERVNRRETNPPSSPPPVPQKLD